MIRFRCYFKPQATRIKFENPTTDLQMSALGAPKSIRKQNKTRSAGIVLTIYYTLNCNTDPKNTYATVKSIKATIQNEMFKKALSGLVALFVFLALVEGVLHVMQIKPAFANRFFVFNRNYDYPNVFNRDDELLWTLRGPQIIESRFFAKGEYRINSLGMRGEEIDGEETETNTTQTRIAVVGNSCSFGWQVAAEDTYIFALVDSLNANSSSKKFQALNGGIPGYSSYQGKLFYRKVLAPLKPQVTLIMFGWNDQWAAAGNIIDSEQKAPSHLFLSALRMVSRLRIYRLLRAGILWAI